MQAAFGRVFTDHMVSATWTPDAGWHDAGIVPYGPIALDPAAAVLHYAQEIFEGLKAYRLADGSMALFRVEANAARFNASAERLAMPALPVGDTAQTAPPGSFDWLLALGKRELAQTARRRSVET